MHIVIYVTCKNKTEANKISKQLLKEKLVACANVVSDINSMYWWQGEINNDREVLMILKSQRSLFDRISKVVIANHSYTVPEIIAMPIVEGNPDYLKWINETTKGMN